MSHDDDTVARVQQHLVSGGTQMPENWNRRFKQNRDKTKSGDIFQLAEVVRDLSLLDSQNGLSVAEKQMYTKTKKALASKLSQAHDTTEDDALEWIETTLASAPAPVADAEMNVRPSKPKRSLAERHRLAALNSTYGPVHPQVICAHCQTRGAVRIKREKTKKGVSGGKATAAVLTGGVSLLATGLSRKDWVTQAHCESCGVTWYL